MSLVTGFMLIVVLWILHQLTSGRVKEGIWWALIITIVIWIVSLILITFAHLPLFHA